MSNAADGPQESSRSRNQLPPHSSPLLLYVLLFVAAAVGLAAWYFFTVQQPMEGRIRDQQELIVKLSGLQTPVANRLDAAYADTNGDLVAAPPADASKFIDPPTLRFSYVYSEDSSGYKAAFADLMKSISDATGKPVDYVDARSTSDQLSMVKHNELDITAFNTGTVPTAVCAAGFVPVAGLGSDKGSSKYEMEILVRANSSLQSVADLAGHELTLTDPGSNSGYKAPLVLIKSDYGLWPGRDYAVRYSGGQERSIAGLADGTYQAVAVANDVLQREIAAGVIKPEQFRSIYKSETFPTAAFGYAYNLKPDLVARIRQVLLGVNFTGTSMEKLFAGSGQDRLVAVDYKNDWALVRRIDDMIGFQYSVK
jgi:phosphonate transport system substrate-binding protein